MNFMSGRSGFYEETSGSKPMLSSSSSLHQNPLHPYGSASGASLPESSPTNNGSAGDDDSDDHILGRRSGNEGSSSTVIEREHMFDKVVTPSDVGKLNRLVIPKQHAEKYFPLDSTTHEKGLLLNFEDRNGKPWRFRYSYWNSSQSYVMTKGWSRFVKEKKLDAGDIVSFQRGLGELGKDRLFIDWRRRPDAPELLPPPSIPHQFSFQRWNNYNYNNNNNNNNPFLLQPPTSRDYYYNYPNIAYGSPCPITYFRSAAGGGGGVGGAGGGVFGAPPQVGLVHARIRESGVEEMVYESVPVVQGKAAPPKRLRLFGVTMDCPISDVSDECDIMSTTATLPLINHFDSSSSSSSLPNSLQLRPYNHHHDDDDDEQEKGKGTSMSLDLDI